VIEKRTRNFDGSDVIVRATIPESEREIEAEQTTLIALFQLACERFAERAIRFLSVVIDKPAVNNWTGFSMR
jgi:hypothetical protein